MNASHTTDRFIAWQWFRTTAAALVVAASLFASGIAQAQQLMDYAFSGNGGSGGDLTGTFSLDPHASWELRVTQFGNSFGTWPYVEGTFASPRQEISGTYSGYSFAGIATLYAVDQPATIAARDQGLPDSWIVRADVAGPSFDGKSVTRFNLFVYAIGLGLAYDTVSLTPPPLRVNPLDSFQSVWSIGFSDGSATFGPLETLAPVPEPSTYALMLAGLAAVGFVVRRRKLLMRCPQVS